MVLRMMTGEVLFSNFTLPLLSAGALDKLLTHQQCRDNDTTLAYTVVRIAKLIFVEAGTNSSITIEQFWPVGHPRARTAVCWPQTHLVVWSLV